MTPYTKIRVAAYIWLAGTAVSLIGAVVTAMMLPGVLAWIVLGISAVQAAIAIPAALALLRGHNWARITLFVLACLSIGSLYQTIQMQAWASLVLNLAMAGTIGLLTDKEVKALCRGGSSQQQPSGSYQPEASA